jgi:hypothetical protein
MHRTLPEPLEAAVQATLSDWQAGDKVRRLWARDATLWTGKDEAKWLDWLHVADHERGDEATLQAFAAEVQRRGFTHVAILGMGGSSLCPHVLAHTFGQQPGCPALTILDSTDPAQIQAFEAGLDLSKTLFIVSSKSGTTLEAISRSSPTPAPLDCKSSPESGGTCASSSVSLGSEGVIRRCHHSGWSRQQRWASMWAPSSMPPKKWYTPASRAFRPAKTQG